MLHVHHAPRDSHYGWPLPTKQIDSVIPSLTMTRNGVDREMLPPFQQSGRVVDVDHDNGTTTVAIGGDGKNPDQRLTFETDQLSLAMSGVPQPAQEHRQKTEPDRSIAYPAPMWAVTPQQAPAQAQQRQHDKPAHTVILRHRLLRATHALTIVHRPCWRDVLDKPNYAVICASGKRRWR